MKKIILLMLLFSPLCLSDDWTREEKILQTVYYTFHAVDWLQTRAMSNGSCRSDGYCWEQNEILGRNPEPKNVDLYFLATGILHYYVADNLPREWRNKFQYLTIGVQIKAVDVNHRLSGINIKYAF